MSESRTWKFDEGPSALVINAGSVWALRFNRDGSVEANPELKADEAAKAVIDVLAPYLRALFLEKGDG